MSSIKLRVLGAACEVTGSLYMLDTGKSKILVDCGMHQGRDAEKRDLEQFPFAAKDVDAVVLTHAHIDHSGRIPLLARQGFKGKVWATEPTIELSAVLLRDTAKLMAEEAQWRTRKNARKGLPPVVPIYNDKDVEKAIECFEYLNYDEVVQIAPDVHVRYRDAGHILGSAVVEVWLGEQRDIKIVFSGDLGPLKTVIEKTPSVVEEADYVVIESTYGDRLHRTMEETREEFRTEMGKALAEKAKILVPTFVVDRAQRVLHEMLLLQQAGTTAAMPPIFFDSPMGAKATEIYERNTDLLSRDMQHYIKASKSPFEPKGLKYTRGAEESQAINNIPEAIVLAGSGMCSGGRIVHHLKHNLWRDNCHVFFVGYQARGTLGRRLVEGEKNVRVLGEEVTVRAKLHTLNGFSAHGDRKDLLGWASNFDRGVTFFVTHGERESAEALGLGLKDLGYNSVVPVLGSEYALNNGAKQISKEPAIEEKTGIDRVELLNILGEISQETAGLRDALETIDSLSDYAAILPLLESTKLVLKAASAMKRKPAMP